MIRHPAVTSTGLMALTLWSSGCAPLSPRKVATRPATIRQVFGVDPDEVDPELAALLSSHNRLRLAAKLPPLTLNPMLSAAAAVQAKDMASHSKMSHSGSDGSTPFQRIERQGYHYQKAAENVAYGQRDASAVMISWMESPPHKENILGDTTEMGAAKALDADGVPYWCVDFGRPWPTLSAAEASEGVLKAINEARSAEKLSPLSISPNLNEAARRQAALMAAKGSLDAREEDGKTALQRLSETNHFRALAERDASGATSGPGLVKGWLGDINERKNLFGDFDRVGIGQVSSKDGTPFWSVIFASER